MVILPSLDCAASAKDYHLRTVRAQLGITVSRLWALCSARDYRLRTVRSASVLGLGPTQAYGTAIASRELQKQNNSRCAPQIQHMHRCVHQGGVSTNPRKLNDSISCTLFCAVTAPNSLIITSRGSERFVSNY